MKVAIFNVKYSPNLGDGIIALCLEREMQRRSGWRVFSIDLAGRTHFAHPGSGVRRTLMLAVLQSLPRRIRDLAVEALLGAVVKSRLRRRWRKMLSGAQFAVFGGGQLFQDGDLNFPIKLAAAVAECERKQLPLAIFAVGAAPSQSARGRRLMRRLAQYPRVVHATARDPQSCASLLDLGREATICRDPGLLAAGAWPLPVRRPRARPLIGVGLTHPVLLAHHTSCRASPSYEGAVSLYTEMIGSICAQDCDVVCFTNGASEDERLLEVVRQQRNLAGLQESRLSFAPRCRSPGELARLIGRLDAVVAHRLHASVLAYAYRLPSVGLLWDDKLQAFYESVGRSKYLVPFDHANAVRIGSLVNEVIAEGIDAPAHARVLQETRQAIDDLVRTIAARTGAPLGDGRISPPCTSGSRPQALPASPGRWMGAA